MPSRESPRALTRRALVERFAAHVAHLLNTGESVMEVDSSALFLRLITDLSGQNAFKNTPMRSNPGENVIPFGSAKSAKAQTVLTAVNDRHAINPRYLNGLVGYSVAGAGRSPEEAAEGYFRFVFERPLKLARGNETHKGHSLLLASCRRGADPLWGEANLYRDPNPSSESAYGGTPDGFSHVATRLARLNKTISPGNPAAKTRKDRGPLYLVLGEKRAEVAEEMSLWDAICCAPKRLKTLETRESFDSFCSLMIKVFETADAPYSAILSLGLSPFDWGETLTVNTAKKLSAFLGEVRQEATVNENWRGDLEAWTDVWERRQVPGFKSVDELWHSELGRALRMPQITRLADDFGIEDSNIAEVAGHEDEILDEKSFDKLLTLAAEEGVIASYDVWLMLRIYEGEEIGFLEDASETINYFGGKSADFSSYIEKLQECLYQWGRRRIDDLEEVSDHPDKDNGSD